MLLLQKAPKSMTGKLFHLLYLLWIHFKCCYPPKISLYEDRLWFIKNVQKFDLLKAHSSRLCCFSSAESGSEEHVAIFLSAETDEFLVYVHHTIRDLHERSKDSIPLDVSFSPTFERIVAPSEGNGYLAVYFFSIARYVCLVNHPWRSKCKNNAVIFFKILKMQYSWAICVAWHENIIKKWKNQSWAWFDFTKSKYYVSTYQDR